MALGLSLGLGLGCGNLISAAAAAVTPVDWATAFPGSFQVAQTDKGILYGATMRASGGATSVATLSSTTGLATPVPITITGTGAGVVSISFDEGVTQTMVGVTPSAGVPVALTGKGSGASVSFSTTAIANGHVWQATGTLQDTSGNGKHFTQATASKQAIITVGLNGKAGLWCVAANSNSLVSALNLPAPGTTPYYVFAVFRQKSWIANSTMWGRGSGTGETLYCAPSTPTLTHYTGVTTITNGGAAIDTWVVAELTATNNASDTKRIGTTTTTGNSGNIATTGLEIGSATGIAYGDIELLALIHTPNLPDWNALRALVNSASGYGQGNVLMTPAAATGPTGITSMMLWLDGSSTKAYSDAAGATLATATGRVKRVNQPGSMVGWWLSATDALRPLRDFGNKSFDVLVGDTAITAPPIPLVANNSTIALSYTRRGNRSNDVEYLLLGNNGVGRHAIVISSNQLVVLYEDSSAWGTGITVSAVDVSASIIVRFNPTSIDILANINGVQSSASSGAVTVSARNTQLLTVGRNTTAPPNASVVDSGAIISVSQVHGYASSITDAERTALMTWLLANKAPDLFTTAAPLVLFEGDSISTDGLIQYSFQSWVHQVLRNLWPTADVRGETYAISGTGVSQAAARYAANIKTRYSASRSKNILVFFSGTNDLSPGGANVATVLAAHYAYCDTARADGFKVFIGTMLPRTVGAFGTAASFEADRQTWNTDVIANGPSHADGVINFAAISGMGANGDSANTTYYQDGVHPTAAGMALMATAATSVISPFLP